MAVRVCELDDVDDIFVAETCAKVVQSILSDQGVQGVRTSPVSENRNMKTYDHATDYMRHPPEDPPSDGDHPHDNGDHQHDVVHHIAPKLAKTSSDVVATSLMREE